MGDITRGAFRRFAVILKLTRARRKHLRLGCPLPFHGHGRLSVPVIAVVALLVPLAPPAAAGTGPHLPKLSFPQAGELLAQTLRGLESLFSPAQPRQTSARATVPSAGRSPVIGRVVSGSPQEITSLRTETAKFFRMPDGSHVAHVYPGPIHFRDGQGHWQDIDTTLVRSLAPGFAWQNTAGSFSARFTAAAGPDAMEEVSEGAQAASFGLAGALPAKATADGNTITYRGVLPGVDLRFEVRPDGVKELVILTEKPAATPVLRFPIRLSGLTARQGRSGAVALVDAEGKTRFQIPRAFATDSATGGHTGQGAFTEVPIGLDTSGGTPALVVSPDPAWLTDPARAYPVTIDPSVNAATTGDTFVQSNITITPQGSSTELKAGTYDGTTKARSLLGFSMSGLSGTEIMSAKLNLYEFWSWSCSARQVNAYRVTSAWSGSSTVWGSQPSVASTPVATLNAAKGYSSSCPAGWVTFDVTPAVAGWVAGTFPNYGLEARAASETDVYGWKKFNSDDATANHAYLAITYDTPPTVPALDSPSAGATVPSVVPVLKATSTDADTDPMDYQFQIAADTGFTTVVSTSPWLPTTTTWTVPPGSLKDGHTYYWRARARDDWYTSGWSTGRGFNVRALKLGSSDSWPMRSYGPAEVNLANGNLMLAAPGPSYPTAAGSMAAGLTFNSLDTTNRGLGTGWALDAGDELAAPPEKLMDHSRLSGAAKFDAAEVVFPQAGSDYYTHVGSSGTYRPPPGDDSDLRKNPDGTWTLTDEDGTIYTFSAANTTTGEAALTGAEIPDASPGQGKLTYTFTGTKVSSISDQAGRSLSFNWSCTGALLCITGPDGVKWSYVGDAAGRLARINDGTRDVLATSYNAGGQLTAIQDANDLDPAHASPGYDGSHAVTIGYDASGRVASVTDGPVTGQSPASATWTFAYTINPGAVSTTPTRATHAGVAAGTVRLADGYTTVTPPNQQGASAPKAEETYFDNLGHPMETDDVLGNVTEESYNELDQLSWTEDEAGNPTDYAYDPVDQVLTSVTGPDPDGTGPLPRPVTSYRYDEQATGTASAPGPALQGLQSSYYANTSLSGRPAARQTDPAVDFNWSTNGPPALGGQLTNYSVRWTADVSAPATGSYTFYTAADDGTRLTVDGLQLIDDWTAHGVRTDASRSVALSAGWHKLALEYFQGSGSAEVHLKWSCAACSPALPTQVIPSSTVKPAWLNQTSEISPAGIVTFHHFANPAAGHPDYDLQKLANGSNVITSYAYDSTGRMTQEVMPKGNASRTIDAGGNLSGSPNLAYATTWAYYGLADTPPMPAACGTGTAPAQGGLLKNAQRAGMAAETTVYDAAGRPTAVTNAAGTTCTTYDAEGKLTSDKAPGETSATTYTYDPSGAQRTATSATGTVTIDYDEAGRVERAVDSYGAEAAFGYDPDGNLTRRVAATGGLAASPNYTTSYRYDAADQLTSLTDPANRTYTFTYDPRGDLHASQYPNGTFSWYDHNAAGWLTAVYNRHGTLPSPLPSSVPTDAQNSPIADYSYGYRVDGDKTSETRTGGGLAAQATSYAYDPLGRLAEVTLPNGTIRDYGYDTDSNRTSITETPPGGSAATVATYSYSAVVLDQLASLTQAGQATDFGYDSDGNTTAKGSATLTWDGRGRIAGGTFAGATLSYAYDPMDRISQRTSGATVTRYLFAGTGDAPMFQTTLAGSITETDVDGPAGDLAHYAGPPATTSAVSFLYYNGHGDTAAEADTSGTRTTAYTYDPFGAAQQAQPANTTVKRWTGRWDKQLDTTSGLIQMGARPYDPTLGRFLTVDPAESGSLNSYDYAAQDPINDYDLTGDICWSCAWHHVWRAARWVVPRVWRAANWVWMRTGGRVLGYAYRHVPRAERFIGPHSWLFGYHGVLNRGPVRIGWGRHHGPVFRFAFGWHPRYVRHQWQRGIHFHWDWFR